MKKLKLPSKIAAFSAAVLMLSAALSSCKSSADKANEYIEFSGDYASVEYIEALANNKYYLDYSLFTGGVIISNTVARDGDITESRSNYGGSISHVLAIEESTYFLDDENKVYFKAETSADGGLYGAVDYSKAEYIGSGTEEIAIGEYSYDEFSCKTISGDGCGVKLYTDSDGKLAAIVDYSGENTIERDVAEFSSEIPDGWLKIPKGYKLVSEDKYFDEYYGK